MAENLSVSLIAAARELARAADELAFSLPVAYVYNPLLYARRPHEEYLSRYGRGRKRTVFVGMNPGPWGMAQTGVPFGEVAAVRDWMQIQGAVEKPAHEHPSRQVRGFDCPRSEVSGKRLWALVQERFGDPEAFFGINFVGNYCPLMFLEESGRNRTPDKLRFEDRRSLLAICDTHLCKVIDTLEPEWVIGVGRFTESRIRVVSEICGHKSFSIGRILHPSPANPQANRNWATTVTDHLVRLGVWTGGGISFRSS
jgi:single-strand selective monofunctional uracil DNA glycosylase